MTMEDVWVETVHELERRDGKKNKTVLINEDNVAVPDTKKRSATSKDNRTKHNRRRERKPAA
jgi:hypothetical protein